MWAQIINAMLGLWLMAAPGVFHFGKLASNNDHIIGPLIVTFAVVAWWECTRGARKFNIPLAGWLLIAPWILEYNDALATANDMIMGGLVLLLSRVKGTVTSSYGGGWSSLWKSDTLHERASKK